MTGRGITPEQATAELIRTVPILEEEGMGAMQRAVELTFQRMTEFAPKGETGNLARDIQHTVHHTRDGIKGTVRPRARYANLVEGGTGQGKTVRSRGRAFSASTGRALSAAEEAASPFDVLTASGWGPKTARALAIHGRGGVTFRSHVRGQRARGFIERTREATADDVDRLLAEGAQRATDRLFG